MPYKDPEKRSAYYRERNAKASVGFKLGRNVMDMLRALAAEDRVPMTEFIRRLIVREHMMRAMARMNR